jgi:S-adenosylmethionine decarboxylase proenzyme
MDSDHTVGTHLIVNLYDVNPGLLKTLTVGLPILHTIVSELRLTVVSQTGYQFEPFGYTYAFVLSESHFTIHTYPEYRSCYIDIFCCNKDFDSIKAVELICSSFGTTTVTHQTIMR